MPKYFTHTACDIGKVPKRAVPKDSTIEQEVQTYLVQMKYDGVCGILIHAPDGSKLITRTGETVHSCDHIIDALDALPFDVCAETLVGSDHPVQRKYGVYIGELWHPTMGQSNISGAVRRHEATEQSRQLQFVVCDFLTLWEWGESRSDIGFEDRIGRIAWMQAIYHPDDGGQFADVNKKPSAPPIWFAGHEGYLLDQAAVSVAALADEAVAAGAYDGIILRKHDGPWTQGARDENIIKVKPTPTYDLTVVDVEEGKGKYVGMLGKLVVSYKGNRLGVSGMTDAQRREWWKNPGTIIGQVVEVAAMGESSKGLLREPRFKGIRYDSADESVK